MGSLNKTASTVTSWGTLAGQGFVLFIMAVAASEVAVGLALIIYARRRTGTVNADQYNLLKG